MGRKTLIKVLLVMTVVLLTIASERQASDPPHGTSAKKAPTIMNDVFGFGTAIPDNLDSDFLATFPKVTFNGQQEPISDLATFPKFTFNEHQELLTDLATFPPFTFNEHQEPLSDNPNADFFGTFPAVAFSGQQESISDNSESEFPETIPTMTFSEPFESISANRWRSDKRCGGSYPLPDGSAAECDPDSDLPCCDEWGWCGSRDDQCHCPYCIDYRIVRKLNESETLCIVTEVGGFLKNICAHAENKIWYYFKCPHSDVNYESQLEYDRSSSSYTLRNVSTVCENDPHSYQACGFNTETTNTDVLCGGYLCHNMPEPSNGTKYSFTRCGKDCNPLKQCSTSSTEASGIKVTSKILCDDTCDQWYCKDESDCNGYRYGVSCKISGRDLYLPPHAVCDGFASCDGSEDEQDCAVEPSLPWTHSCFHYASMTESGSMVTVPILSYTRCSVFDVTGDNHPYCLDYMDQTNCSDIERVGGYCFVQGYMTSVSKYVVCHDYDTKLDSPVRLCDDGIENECIWPSVSEQVQCKVHKHKMCDGVYDCPDGSDEHHEMCIRMTAAHQCTRRFGSGTLLAIPLGWIMDGQIDCFEGEDENADSWLLSGDVNSSTLRVNSGHTECQNVFLCPGEDRKFVHLELLCDGVESCGIENSVCQIARDFPAINTSVVQRGSVGDICDSLHLLDSTACAVKEFIRPSGNVFGSSGIILNVPTSKVDCSNLFGEYYVFLSCMNLCLNSPCPLDNNYLMHDSCPGQFPERTLTLANNSYLTFVTRDQDDDRYQQNYFKCTNGRCIEYKQVCDLINDCGDFSDEINCTNHMISQYTVHSNEKQLITQSQKCDGIFDSYDLSDECNELCGREILGHWVLKCVCWLMGILALIFNAGALIKNAVSLKNSNFSSLLMLYNMALVSLINLGDFLVGVYLILLSIYDSLVFGKDFCTHQAEWLTSPTCSTLGVISTIGSQLSLFSMTTLSIVRLVALLSPSMSMGNRTPTQLVLRILPSVIVIIVSSLVVALLPLAPSLQDFFVQGIYYDPSYKVFIGFPNKAQHVRVLQAYYKSENISYDMSWKEIGSFVDGMFSQTCGSLSRSTVHFYANDGVCLFKYFVRSDDPKRSRHSMEGSNSNGNEMVWLMLLINFLCFMIITVMYIFISIKTSQSSRTGEQDHGLQTQSKTLQRKISILIATDFLCWIPFIVVSSLHNLQIFDATTWYVPFAMTVLPLNSVINPLIYDSTIHDLLRKKFRTVHPCIRCINLSTDAILAEDQTKTENIGMGTTV